MRPKLPLIFLTLSATVFILSLFILIPAMPDRVATHFDQAGNPNGSMTRGQYLSGITVLGIALSGFVIGICHCIRFFPPSTLNFSGASFWRSPEQYLRACRLLLNWSYCFGGISFLWISILNYQLIEANRLHPPHLAPGPVIMLSGAYLTLTTIAVAVFVVRLAKANID